METVHKAFVKKDTPRRKIAFTIAEQEFAVVPSIPGITFMEFARVPEDATDQQMGMMLDFLKVVLGSEWDRFHAVVADPANDVDAEQLSEIFLWLLEAYAGRPFATPSPSPVGGTQNGATSEADVSSPDLIPEASTPATT